MSKKFFLIAKKRKKKLKSCTLLSLCHISI